MRSVLAFAVLALGVAPAPVQAGPMKQQQPAGSAANRAADSVQTRPSDTTRSALGREIARERDASNRNLPDVDLFTLGDRTIAQGTTVAGPVAVARGDLDVYGTVEGDVFALDGDIRVHRGARVTGDAWAVSGSVLIEGGEIDGHKRSIAITQPALPGPSTEIRTPLSTTESVKLTVAWFALLAIIGIGVMVFAEPNLDGVVMALERGFARSFWLGLAGQVALLPVLLLLVAGLAITVLGILLIPFAIVAYVIAAAGLVTLGLLAVARLTGGALASDRGTTSVRGVHLRALAIGLAIYFVVWLVAALFAWSPVIGSVVRAIAIALTWVAATVGLGATLASRAGTQRPGAGTTATGTGDEYAWQTPTPVTGVAAAARKAKVGANH